MLRSKRPPAPRVVAGTKREKIVAFAAQRPTATLVEIGIACDCSPGYAHGVLRQVRGKDAGTTAAVTRSLNGRRAAKRLRDREDAGHRAELFHRRRRGAAAPPTTQDEIEALVAAYAGEVTKLPPGWHYGWRPKWA